MKIRTILASAVSAGVLMAGTSAFSAELKVLASWNKNIWPTYVVLDTFQKNVGKVAILKTGVRLH